MERKAHKQINLYEVTVNSLRLRNINFNNLKGEIVLKNKGVLTSGTALNSSFPINIDVLLPRILAATDAKIVLKGETVGKTIECEKNDYTFERELDIFTFELNLDPGLYFFYIVLYTPFGNIYGYNASNGIMFFSKNNEGDDFQLSAVHFKHSAPIGFSGGIIYHIFVDRFSRSGKTAVREGGVLADFSHGIPEYPSFPGAPLKNNTFWGGDLYGIIEKLDYISSLGANIIYLSPIFDSPSNHKYDTGDYQRVDSALGGDDALRALIREAHARGMKIILDGVFNHTGADSVYFNKYGNYSSLGAYQSKCSEYYDWYEFSDYPNKYTCWWDIDILPRINTRFHKCSDFFVGENGIISKYTRMGIDGFRLDVADELSDEFISKIKSRMEAEMPGSILYGEVWEDASNKVAYSERKKYYLGEELDGVMNYPLRKGIIDYVLYGFTDTLRYALTEVMQNAPKEIRDHQMNLLGSHDTVRIITALGGEAAVELSNSELVHKRMSDDIYEVAKSRLKLAYTILATLPGIPSIFYGDEVGLQGYSDPFNRMPYPWGKEDKEILDFYKKIGIIRRGESVYKEGSFSLISLTPKKLIFARKNGERSLLTVINNSSSPLKLRFTKSVHSKMEEKTSQDFLISPYSSEIFLSDKKETYLIFNSIKE